MFKHILIAVDGSGHSAEAVATAVEVARKFESDIFVLHAWEVELSRAAAFPLETPDEANQLVAGVVSTIKAAGVSATGEVQHAIAGHAAKHIVETAQARGSELIVMGSRGLTGIEGLLLGSVTHKVTQLAHIPVLVVRGTDGARAGKQQMGAAAATSAS
jgi:nucleotide-binding universal stress UspA family protein